MFLKGLIAAALESSEPLHFGLMGVSAPSLHRESTDSLINDGTHDFTSDRLTQCMLTV